MIATLYGDLLAAGVPMDSHESDLYFPDTRATRAILARFPESAKIANRFTDQECAGWWQVPFAYLPWWESRQQAEEMRAGNFTLPAPDLIDSEDLRD